MIDVNRNPGNLTPIVERAHSDPSAAEQHFRFPPTPASAISPTNMDSQIPNTSQRGHRLSLQVPQSLGNPVRLVTPTVLVNGQENDVSTTNQRAGPLYDQPTEQSHHQHHQPTSSPAQPANNSQTSPQPQPQATPSAPPLPTIPPESLKRALVAELIRAPLTGRRKRLSGTEAKALATSILLPLSAAPASGVNTMSESVLAIAISSCLGLTSAVGLGAGGPTGGVRRVECVRFRVGGDGYESPIDEEDDEEAQGTVRESFDVFFNVNFGGLVGEWVVKGVGVEGGSADAEAGAGEREEELGQMPGTAAGWKARFEAVQRRLWEKEEEARVLRERVLEAVL